MGDRKDTIVTALEVVCYAGIAYAIWRSLITDSRKEILVMRLAQLGESHCQRKAEVWAHSADLCRKVYDSHRSVTV